VLKYEIDNSVIFHSDTLGMDNRIGAALAYLNDDYEGGELEFKHFDIKITPPKNSLIMFPSNWPYTHRSNPIVSGKKYAIRCFLVSK
jgi:predicted 2-oxoglutarate/Fe(II)-dependent dioxygenase YbiX